MTSKASFPIARSILSAAALAPLLESAYGLRGAHCQLIKAMILDTYRVMVATDHYILRVYPYRRRDLPEITAELNFVLYLHAQGAPISVPIQRSNGEYVLAISAPEGVRYAALFTYAPGHPLSHNLDSVLVRTYGRVIAQIHAIADILPDKVTRSALDLQMLLERPLADLERVYGHRHADWSFLQQVGDTLRLRVAALSTAAPFYGLCHGDVGAESVHVSETGQLTVFDFDFCGYGWRSYDVATFLIDQPEDVAEAFLAGYQEIRDLSPDEQAAIPIFQILQSIWVLGLRADYVNDWGESSFSDRFANNVLHFIRETLNQI